MPGIRRAVSEQLVTEVMIRSRRRCCLCVFLDGRDEVRPGQLAHLNHVASDNRRDNLVYLCLEHHDRYDGRTSQSKGLTEGELRHWRDLLEARYADRTPAVKVEHAFRPEPATFSPQAAERPWRFPLWQAVDQLELFAYLAGNGDDGVCLLERIDLPDDRVVIACLQAPGNAGRSITNAAEDIAGQVCARFEISPSQLVWLEHYPSDEPESWERVRFLFSPERGRFHDPVWTPMTADLWSDLGLEPLPRLTLDGLTVPSKLQKLFRGS